MIDLVKRAYETNPNDDLGFRWSMGEVSDLQVLAEILGVSESLAQTYIYRGLEDQVDQHMSWKRAGDTFDWLLGGDVPAPIRFELRAEGIDPRTV